MSNQSKDQLIATRVEVENEVNEKQEQLSKATYSVDFENVSNITAILKQILQM